MLNKGATGGIIVTNGLGSITIRSNLPDPVLFPLKKERYVFILCAQRSLPPEIIHMVWFYLVEQKIKCAACKQWILYNGFKWCDMCMHEWKQYYIGRTLVFEKNARQGGS